MTSIQIPWNDLDNVDYFQNAPGDDKFEFIMFIMRTLRSFDDHILGLIRNVDATQDESIMVKYHVQLSHDQQVVVSQTFYHLFEEIHDHI